MAHTEERTVGNAGTLRAERQAEAVWTVMLTARLES
jgi:hypothetical protein